MSQMSQVRKSMTIFLLVSIIQVLCECILLALYFIIDKDGSIDRANIPSILPYLFWRLLTSVPLFIVAGFWARSMLEWRSRRIVVVYIVLSATAFVLPQVLFIGFLFAPTLFWIVWGLASIGTSYMLVQLVARYSHRKTHE